MSEPSSLYARVRLTWRAFDAYLASVMVAPRAYDDWQPWLAKDEMVGGLEALLHSLPTMQPREGCTVREGLDELTATPEFLARSDYDDASQTWRFVVGEFAEDYDTLIREFAILRAVASFKDLDGVDAVVVLPFLFGPEGLRKGMRLERGRSHLSDELPEGFEAEARAALRKLLASMAGQ